MAKYIVQHRRGTMAQWAAHDTVIPEEGEIVIEIDEENSLHKLKIGDGVHTYAELAYLQAGDEIVTQVLAEAKPRIVSVTLSETWNQDAEGKYSQVISLDNITERSRLDLQPNADMFAEFKQLGLVFVTENNGGTITVYSVGNAPLKSYTMQATIVETECDGQEVVLGIPVGAPATYDDIREQVESRNFGENNIINVTDKGAVFGNANTIGGKGYKILKYTFAISNQMVALDPNVTVYEGTTTLELSSTTGITVGDMVSIEMNDSTQRFATVQSISGNTVVLDKAYYDETVANVNEDGEILESDVSNNNFHLILPEVENSGDSQVAESGYVLGINNRTIATNAFATGSGNSAEGKNAFVSGENNIGGYNALVGGEDNVITAEHGFGVGYKNTATARYAAAIGYNNDATGPASMAVGDNTAASGVGAFAQGYNTTASGSHSHAEGNSTKAISGNSHAEGSRTKAGTKAFKIISLSGTVGGAGTYSLDSTIGIQPGMRYSAVTSVAAYDCGEITAIEGNMVKVDNYPGHGINTEDDNPSNFNLYNLFIIVDHPELGTINAGFNAHTEGSNTYAAQVDAHAEGRNTRALGKYSHTEGISTQAGHAAHAEGSETKAIGVVAHAEGAETVAQGNYTHAEGFKSQAVGGHSHAEGQQTTSTGTAAHSEGGITVASGDYSHAEGGQTTAQGAQSHSEGYLTKAIGQQSHAEGYNTQAIGNRSHAGGRDTVANYNDQFVIGRYNSNKEDTLFEVGNGSANSRANAFEVKANGTVYSQGGKLATETYVNEKINSGGTSTQADWNESDSNAAGYVKNRTHYGLQNPEISIPYDAGSPYGQSNYYYDLVSKDGQYIHVHRYNAFGLDEWYKLFVDRSDYSMSDDTPPSPGLAFVEVASKFRINSCGYPYEVWYDTGTIGIEEYDNTQCVYDIYNELVPAEKVLDPRYLPMNVITEGVKSGVSEEIDSKLASLVDSAPETLNTLNELADALGDDPNFATTVATEIGKKVDKVDGKGLSTNDFTNEYKNQIDSHNFGENNTLNVETIGAFGDNNIIGCKAYRILKYRVDEANNKTYVQVDGNSEIVNIPVGTPVTLIFDETATRVANTVNSIAYAENATEIALDKAWVEYHYENTDVRTQYVDVLTGDDYDNLLIFPTYPSIGTTPYGGNGYVAGSDNSALMIYSAAFGKDNSAEGKYGMTIGRENAAGYAAFASGRKCKALGTHSHSEGSGSSVKEIEAGTTILDKYTIPANFEWNDGNGGHAEGFGTTASNNATHAEGYETYAIGSTSHAEGFRTIASGDHSHAEGVGAWSSGKASHAEGSETTAQGENAHAEGRGTEASGNSAHAEGQETKATKNGAHAEGSSTKAEGSTAHAEGYDTEASGDQSHAQNYQTVASGWASTAIGHTTKAGYASQFVAGQFNENKESNLFEIGKGTGENNRANAFEVDRNGNVIAAGNITSASGTLATETFVNQSYVIAGNKDNSSIGGKSTVEGSQNIVIAGTSHAEGESNTITSAAGRAHAEGYNNTVTAWHAHAEGALNTVSGANGHAEGVSNRVEVEGENGHAEGNANIAKGVNAHAEGYGTVAEGNHSHTQNYETKATAWATSAAGQGTVAGYTQQFVVGAYNANKEENIFEVGRGTGDTNRKNAFEVDRNGNARANDKAVVTSSDATPMEIVLRAGQPTDADRIEGKTIIWIDTSALS